MIGSALPTEAPRAAVKNAEDLLIVDCLLPGQIRSLGSQAHFLSARRPIRTTQADCQIRGGEYVSYDRANYQTALKVWMDQAMAGSAEAQNNVGEIYSKGLGTEPDYGMAFQWFKKAADQGYGRAKINLGYLYESGLGVPQDTAAALNLYREASGLKDELLYASVVEVQLKAKDEKIGNLQGQVQSEQANSEQLRQQVKQLQQELAERRRALQASQQQLQQTQDKLAQAKQSKNSELTRFLENQLLTQEQQINSQRSQIASMEQSGTGAGNTMLAGAPVTMEILDPTFVATRGRNTAVVRGVGKRKLVGRVSSAKAIAKITVNGVATPVAENGSFSADIDVAAGGTPVQVAALDTHGGKAQLDFTIIPSVGGAASASMASGTTSGILPKDVKLGRFYAVVIGNNTYRDAGFPALKTAASDATAVSNVLRDRYGYQTTLLLNSSRLETLTALNEMREKLGPQDNLLIYYAGHGEIDGGRQGYWVPADAVAGNSKTWISNAAISDILNAMPARHVLVVADSCYSGAMTRASAPSFDAGSMPADKWGTWVRTMANGRSRTALTSGGVQPVPDAGSGGHSYFAKAFLNALQDNNRLVEAQRVFQEVQTSLALNAAKSALPQQPQYAPIRFAGHESGEFFFIPKGAATAAVDNSRKAWLALATPERL
ncbi:MAG TPA: caspase family protein [Arenimonas sp.]|uniref:caspase family protein n=1 Tax=Arenimonas sp. TaxID=1872635 RepID=UPI002B804BF8|nr:caspase family protein [Arenimonas sp.]HMB57874.1 caspase family protein [Arenimonas sp.]